MQQQEFINTIFEAACLFEIINCKYYKHHAATQVRKSVLLRLAIRERQFNFKAD